MKLYPLFLVLPLLAWGAGSLVAAGVELFDGRTLAGWEGDTQSVWRVREGAIVGGSLDGNPRNEFLATEKTYRNFSLKLEYKLVGTEGFVNGGVQFRSRRIDNPPNEVRGYQADIGAGFSGCLHDESRRNKTLVFADKSLIARVEKPGDWNTYQILCEGARVRLFLNGQQTVDYIESAPGIEQDGVIALQIHGKCKAEIAFRNITLVELPPLLVPSTSEILNRFGNGLASAAKLPPWHDGLFSLGANEVIVFAGQTNFARERTSATLESRLARAFADQAPCFRSMAWEGDTVYDQWRDLNFGSWADQLTAAGATMVVSQFGQMEALDGQVRIGDFKAAYERLLDRFAAATPRLVLVSPMPFERPAASHAPDLTARNGDARVYAETVRELARRRGLVFVDLFTPLTARPVGSAPLTDNGIHLNAEGLRIVSDLIARALGAPNDVATETSGLRASIEEKNRLWLDCWRPANWSFAYGDRISQKFGTPGGDYPSLHATFERHKSLIATLDARIHALARGETPRHDLVRAESVAGLAETPTQLSPEEEQATFTVGDGFEVNLFASEREGMTKPTQIAWDERGRLYVACSPTYPQTLPGVKPADYIQVLEDTDGDGRADTSHRFAEGLTMTLGVEPGAGGVYVCDFDRLLHLRDTDSDGRADEKRVVFSGFGIGDTHQMINSIAHGPDGTLWFTQGLHVFSRIETPWGIERLEKSGIWRLHPRTLRLDGFFSGGKAGHNCWGVAFDDYGQVFHKSGDRPEGYYTVPGMVRLAEPDEYHRVGPLFVTTPKTTAMDIVGTRAMPDELQGAAVIGGYFGNVVEAHRFRDDGAGFVSEQLPKLLRSSSTSFRPVDVSMGPDGAIYIADWFNPVIGHYQASYADPARDRVHGRIWRITAKGRAPVKPPALANLPPTALLDHLRSPERWTRYQAKRLLFDLPSAEVLSAADAWVDKLDPTSPDYERLLLDVVGVFEAHEAVRPDLLSRLLTAKDPRVRAYGARVIGAWSDRLPDALAQLSACLRDPHPRVRLEAVVATSTVPKPQAVEVALAAIDSPRDRFIDYALAQTIRSLEPLWRPAFAAGQLALGGNQAHTAYLKTIAAAERIGPHPGKLVYDSLCLNCHQPEGRGLPNFYPPLEGSEWVAGDAAALIKIVLHGMSGTVQVRGETYGKTNQLPMPPTGLSDRQVADVLTYIRSNFGHHSGAVTPADVSAVREKTVNRLTMWTAEELR